MDLESLHAIGVVGSAIVLQEQSIGLFDAEGRPAYDLILAVEVAGQPPAESRTTAGQGG